MTRRFAPEELRQRLAARHRRARMKTGAVLAGVVAIALAGAALSVLVTFLVIKILWGLAF